MNRLFVAAAILLAASARLLTAAPAAASGPEEGTFAWHKREALAAMIKGDLPKAELEWRLARSTLRDYDVNRLYIFERIGATNVQEGDLREARKNFDRAIEFARVHHLSNETLVDAYLGLAYCLTRDTQYDLAMRTYSSAYRLSKNNSVREIILHRMEAVAGL